MHYLLLIYSEESAASRMSREDGMALMGAYMAYTHALREAGVLISGEPLQPTASATSVRVRNGKTELIDGPFAETKEQLGGYYLIDVADADEALHWAARCPGAEHGTLEVRPIMELPATV